MAERAGLRPHVAKMILTAEHLAGLDAYAGLGRWLHMLGFRGHFTTKSRRFSVTLGALRQARRDYRAARDDRPGEPEPDVADAVADGCRADGDQHPCLWDAPA